MESGRQQTAVQPAGRGQASAFGERRPSRQEWGGVPWGPADGAGRRGGDVPHPSGSATASNASVADGQQQPDRTVSRPARPTIARL